MVIINEKKLNEFVNNLKKDGWNGNKNKLNLLISSALENNFVENNNFLVCKKFIYKRSKIVNTFCQVYINDQYIIIVEQESLGASIETDFDSFVDALEKTSPLSYENIKKLEFIVISRNKYFPSKVSYDFKSSWSLSNVRLNDIRVNFNDSPFNLNSSPF